jgi:hypothetical protein
MYKSKDHIERLVIRKLFLNDLYRLLQLELLKDQAEISYLQLIIRENKILKCRILIERIDQHIGVIRVGLSK